MKVLIACESSGTVRSAFRAKGHDAYSCDLLPADDGSPFHFVGNALQIIDNRWDLIIAHPPCTFLCSSGLWRNNYDPTRQAKTDEAVEFFLAFTKLTCPWCIENPVGCMGRLYRKADQYVQPYEYGHDASKRTGFWLNKLKPLIADISAYIKPRIVIQNGKEYKRWANQTDSGQNRLGPSKDRWKQRSKTYYLIAKSMADQWG